MLLRALQGDITACTTDAIVNAANNQLIAGSGVCGAIYRAAGSDLTSYCQKLNGCATGAAIITPGFNLLAKYIIHAVGPIWQGGDHHERELLASCYRSCIEIASTHQDIKSIAFPAISCGVYGFPLELAVPIAVKTVQECVVGTRVQEVVFVCFEGEVFRRYEEELMHINSNFNQCPLCGQGELLVVQDLESQDYLIMCDDCESSWTDPNESSDYEKCLNRNYTKVRDATQEEIRKLGWVRFYKDEI